jgi:hypothetical protein
MLLLRIAQEFLISAAADARTTRISRLAIGPAIVDWSKAFFAQCVTTIDFLIARSSLFARTTSHTNDEDHEQRNK